MAKHLNVSDNGRCLQRADGSPFFWMGDTAWQLFHRLDREDAERYLRNRADKGFTVIQAVVLAELGGLDVPNPYGHRPLQDNDPTRPVDGYFEHVDWIVGKAESLGLVVGMLPTWGSYWNRTNPGSKSIFTRDNARTYGRFLGERYADKPIVWILGGDRFVECEEENAVIRLMAAGLRDGDGGNHLITFHPRGPGRSSETYHLEKWLDFNMSQTSHASRHHDTGLSTAADYAFEPAKPTLDGEPRYEGIPVGFYNKGASPHLRFTDADARSAAYLSLLAGACGHTYGNNNVWQMWEPGRDPVISADLPWYQALDHPGAFQMGYLARLFQSRPFPELRPAPECVLDAPQAGPAKVRAAMAEDKSWAMIYSTQGAPFALNKSVFSASRLAEFWFDPRTGAIRHIHSGANHAYQTFDPPTSGYGQDWLLLLEDPERGFPAELFTRDKVISGTEKIDRPADW